MKKGDLVGVEWVDADSAAGWQPDDDEADDKAESMISYGLLVSKGSKFVTLSHCYNKDGDEWLSKHRIPISFIVGIELIRSLQPIEDMTPNSQ